MYKTKALELILLYLRSRTYQQALVHWPTDQYRYFFTPSLPKIEYRSGFTHLTSLRFHFWIWLIRQPHFQNIDSSIIHWAVKGNTSPTFYLSSLLSVVPSKHATMSRKASALVSPHAVTFVKQRH